MLELLTGIHEVQRATRSVLGEQEAKRRRRAPASRSGLVAARRFVSDATVALTVPWPAPPVRRPRHDLRPRSAGAR